MVIIVNFLSFNQSWADLEINFTIDKHVYYLRDTIYLNGFVNVLQTENDVIIEVLNSKGLKVFLDFAVVDRENKDLLTTLLSLVGLGNHTAYLPLL